MMTGATRRVGVTLLAILATAAIGSPIAQAQERPMLPEGTVITVTTDEPLNSGTMQQGEEFTTSVIDSVEVEGLIVVPAGSEIVGEVTQVRQADDRDSGVLGMEFTTLRLPNGETIAIDGKLTRTDPAERRQIESRGDAQVVLVGHQRGVGGTVSALTGRDASDPASSVLGVIGGLLLDTEGSDIELPAGRRLAIQLERPVVFSARGTRTREPDASTIHTSEETVRAAQEALRQRGYYRGPIDGQLSESTQRALLGFQIDNDVLATGDLDGRTAELLDLRVNVAPSLTTGEASFVRRTAQSPVTRWRDHVGISAEGRMDTRRTYERAEVNLYFALSAFADNAGLYEQIVRTSGKVDGLDAANAALVGSARDVDAAMEAVQVPSRTEATWRQVQRVLAHLDPEYGPE